MEIGSVPGEIDILLEYREVTGTPPGGIWALVGLSGREERWPEMGRAPLPPFEPLYTKARAPLRTQVDPRDHIRNSELPSVHQNI